MLNDCNFIGHLGKDPECGMTGSGIPFARFSIAVTKKWKDQQTGEKKEQTEWIPVTLWRGLAEIAGKYLHKGDKVFIKGEFHTRKWEKDGVTRYATDIIGQDMVMLNTKSGGGAPPPDESTAPPARKASGKPEHRGDGPTDDAPEENKVPSSDATDDLPF